MKQDLVKVRLDHSGERQEKTLSCPDNLKHKKDSIVVGRTNICFKESKRKTAYLQVQVSQKKEDDCDNVTCKYQSPCSLRDVLLSKL